ncbi:hypothetical protein ACL1IT_14120 [Corynebacterium striatum]|nr:hypothetical protein [Corynebacterium striatum]HAT1477533.1 hypothetical protein [Corynebacterium striatum]HCG2977220.1 hypothetical protein [Corynebacterium striatum]HCG2990644.1 hypothetical protein [Corynebacterium striatum]HCG3146372.1 hypothetical protein [Corynebacterium striatum]
MQTLKISDKNSDAWEQHYFAPEADTVCGYKIHVNLTEHQFQAGKTLLVEEYSKRRVDFKVCNTQSFCERLNSGNYGVTQIGKAATVYVATPERLSSEAQFLQAMLAEFSGPCPPTDLRIPNSGILSYRWEARNETQAREICSGVPLPVFDPIGGLSAVGNPFLELKKAGIDLIITRCLRQSSKGAVYEGIAKGTRVKSPATFRPVILKEFRKYASKSHLGHDAWDIGRSEIKSYKQLRPLHVTPQLFWEGTSNESIYLLLESPAGFVPLQEFAKNLSTECLDIICSRVESLIKTIANSDVRCIDVSPSNILINNKLEIKAIDFEIISDERGTTYYGLHPVLKEQAPTPRELVSLLRGSLEALIRD